VDLAAREKYAEIGHLRDVMMARTHAAHAPWFVVDYDDQKQGRLALMRHLLDQLPDVRVPDVKVKLPRLRGKPKREKLTDASFWIAPRG
jgi:hypothetical protein